MMNYERGLMADTEFDHDQYAEAYPPGIERFWWHVARNRVIADTLAAHLPRATKVLEVGCGTGIVTAHLRARGWDVTGVDLGQPQSGTLASEHLLFGQDATKLPKELRDGIGALLLFDVIEHIADAPAFLRDLLAAFPNVRLVVITVPARKELWTTFDDHFGHFRRYDRAMLRNELGSAGLEPGHLAYFFHSLYPAILVNNLLRGRERDLRFVPPPPGFRSTLNRSVGALFALDARLLPKALVGSSLIAVAHRPPASTST